MLCVLIFYVKIFQWFGSTSISRIESHGIETGTLYYEVEGKEYKINYDSFGLDDGARYSESDTVYYLISDPSYYLLNRPTLILVFSIAEVACLIMICAPIVRAILKNKKRSKLNEKHH
jgi:hypothetical protein